jgi:hypothetical protein
VVGAAGVLANAAFAVACEDVTVTVTVFDVEPNT